MSFYELEPFYAKKRNGKENFLSDLTRNGIIQDACGGRLQGSYWEKPNRPLQAKLPSRKAKDICGHCLQIL